MIATRQPMGWVSKTADGLSWCDSLSKRGRWPRVALGDVRRRSTPSAAVARRGDSPRLSAPLRSPFTRCDRRQPSSPDGGVWSREQTSPPLVLGTGPAQGRAAALGWRNWQTRRIQDPVGTYTPVGVRLPPRAFGRLVALDREPSHWIVSCGLMQPAEPRWRYWQTR